MPVRRPELQLVAPSASPEEAAAIVAAIDRFMRATAPATAAAAEDVDPWLRAARREAVWREAADDSSDPWINT
jgi:hypothetical protein